MAVAFRRIGRQSCRQGSSQQQQCHLNRSLSSTSSSAANPFQQPDPDRRSRHGLTDPFQTPSSQLEESRPELDQYNPMKLASLAHRELEQHRELRELARLAAWEMPLLSQFAQPFEKPTKDQVLRWRYTTYMGELHPAQRKVVVEFNPFELEDLNEQQRLKLLKLAGVRYNPTTRRIKMSCESFETPAQNKRYLATTIRALIAEAKDPNADSFEDIPLDLRHHKPPKKYKFPDAWALTPERRKALEEKRKEMELKEGKRVEEGALVDGQRVVDEAMKISDAQQRLAPPQPVMATRNKARVLQSTRNTRR